MNYEVDLKQFAWQAFDSLRGVLEASKGVHVILALLIVKFFSDIRRARQDGCDHSSWPTAWKELAIPPECNWEKLHELGATANFSHEFDRMVRSVEQRNFNLLDGVLRILSFNDFREYPHQNALLNAIQLIAQIDLNPAHHSPDDIGNVFDQLLQIFSETLGKNTGTFYVPHELSSLIADIVKPQQDEVILDPVCGAGLLLAKLAMREGSEVAGQDWRAPEIALCKMNLLLHGISNSHLQVSNALAFPLLDKKGKLLQADIVVSNPPFGIREQQGQSSWMARFDIQEYGVAPHGLADYAFIAHMLETARAETGRVAVIVSLGALTRDNGVQFRRHIVEENLLAGVISLPSNLFQTTRVPVAILFFKKSKATSDVLFVDASKCYATHGLVNQLTDQGIRRTAKAIHDFRESPGFSRRVSQDEIRDNNYLLSVPLYIEQRSNKPELSALDATNQKIRLLESELDEVRSKLNEALREVGVQFS